MHRQISRWGHRDDAGGKWEGADRLQEGSLANKSCQIGVKPAAVHSMSLFPAFCFGHNLPEPLRVSTACRVESPYYVYTSSSLQYCRLVYDSSSKSDAQQQVLRPAAFKDCESYVTVCMPHTSAYGRPQVE